MQAESPSSPQESADRDDEELRRVLAASEAFDDDLLALLRAGWNTSSRRSTICLAFCRSAIEHAIAQRVLIEAGLTGTALSLIRLQYSHDEPAPDLRDNAISLQYQAALGAHGAHKF